MALEPVDLVRGILSFGGFAAIVFTLGAYVGWRAASPADRLEPTWLFLLAEASWLSLIAALFLNEPPPGWQWMRWLPPITFVLWSVAFVLRVRGRHGARQ